MHLPPSITGDFHFFSPQVNTIAKQEEKAGELHTEIDLSCQSIAEPILNSQHLQPFMEAAHSKTIFKKVNVSGCRLDLKAFEMIITIIKTHPGVKELCISKSLLTESQKDQLIELTGINTLKGLKITTSEGEQIGPVHTNWGVYAEEKRYAYKKGMRESTFHALHFIKQELGRPPAFTLDFGAGTGVDAINLALAGCPKIWAVDGDEHSLNILQENVRELQKSKKLLPQSAITCTNVPFIHLEVPEAVELLVSSFTWPYRRSADFPACWKKCVEIIKIGGCLSGQFFGPRSGKEPDPGMTYHTEKELRDLLSKEFEIVWFFKEPEGGEFNIYGGTEPPWGDLYHVVAKHVSKEPQSPKEGCSSPSPSPSPSSSSSSSPSPYSHSQLYSYSPPPSPSPLQSTGAL